jgi:hypothetical protein
MTTTTYVVTVTDANGCQDADTVVVTVRAVPNADAGADKQICLGSGTTIGNLATGGTSPYTYAWLPTAGLSSSSVAQPTASPTTTTTYVVTVTDANGCQDADTVVVTVRPVPNADAGTDKQICLGSGTTIGNPATGGTSPFTYAWLPTAGLSSSSVAQPTASPATTTTYVVTVTDANGCQDADTVVVTVRPVPNADAGTDKQICLGSGMTIGNPATGGTSPFTYAWLPTAGLSSSSVAQPTASPATTTTYVVTVTDANGCQDADTVVVTVRPVPNADAGTDKQICLGSGTTIGNPATGGTSPYTYAWLPTAGLSSSNVAQPTASPTTTTTYVVAITDANGCQDADTVVVTVRAVPNADAGTDKQICSGTSAVIGNPATGGTAPYTYAWLPTAGLNSSSLAQPMASPTVTTTYVVTATDANGCRAKDSVTVEILTSPTADGGNDKEICSGSNTTIGEPARGGVGPYAYSWTPPTDLSASDIPQPIASPTITTKYAVVVTDANGCRDTAEVLVKVNPLPLADAGSDMELCRGQKVAIGRLATGGTAPYSYAWSPPDGLSDQSVARPTAGPSATTRYSVTVTDAKGCTSTDDVLVSVHESPIADAGVDKTIASGGSTVIGQPASGGTPPYSYSWLPFTSLNARNIAQPIASPTKTTIYSVLVTDSHGCMDEDTVVVFVGGLPAADAGADKQICSGSSVQIGNPAVGGTPPYTYSWSPSTGLSAADSAQPIASPTLTTMYTVTITDAVGGTDTDSVLVTVFPTPSIFAGNDTRICSGASTVIGSPATGGTAPYTYSWTPQAGLNAADVAQPTASPSSTTTYNIVVTDANGCISSDEVVVTVNRGPIADVGADKETCEGTGVMIGNVATGGTPPYSYAWSPATGLNAVDVAQPTANPTVTTSYTVTVTDANGCSDIDGPVIVTVYTRPTPQISGPTIVCAGTSSDYSVSYTAGNTYLWQVSGGTLASGATDTIVTVAWGTTGGGSVSINEQNTHCSATDSRSVVFTDSLKPQITILGSPRLCEGESVSLDAGAGYRYYQWSNGSHTRTINVSQAGSYSVYAENSQGCRGTSDPVVIMVFPRPQKPGITQNGNMLSTALGSWRYAWSLNGVVVSGQTQNVLIATQSGTYRVAITDTNGCTSESDPLDVIINAIATLPQPTALELFPNPTTGELTVRVPAAIGNAIYLTIVDLLGRIIIEKADVVSTSPYECILHIPAVNRGTYVLVVRSGRSQYIRMFGVK